MKQIRFSLIFIILSIISFFRWWFIYDQPIHGIDDANIYFVYAKNLAEGNGFVYNVGGERVEGFTSMLWVLLLTLFYQLGSLEWLSLIFNFLLVSYTLYRLTLFADSPEERTTTSVLRLPGAFILLFICLIPGYLDWTILTHMETGLWSSLLILTSLQLFRQFKTPKDRQNSRILMIFLPLLLFTRPESLLWIPLFLLIQLGQLIFRRMKVKEIVRYTWPPVATTVLAAVLLFGFRIFYFGYPFPNTFYAKVTDTVGNNIVAGAYYMLRHVKENPFAPAFVIILTLGFFFIWRELYQKRLRISSAIELCIISLSALNFVFPFYAGGDHFYLSRFLQPMYPILLLGVFYTPFWKRYISFHLPLKGSQAASLSLVVAGMLILTSTRFSLLNTSAIQKEFDVGAYGRNAGDQLNRLFSRTQDLPLVGTYMAGGFAYIYEGNIIDLMGLNNTAIAHAPDKKKGGYKNHSAFNKRLFYEFSPDILHIDFLDSLQQARLNEHDREDFQNQIYQFIFLDDKFRKLYKPVVISGGEEKIWYQAYIHHQYLEKLLKEGYNVYRISRKKKTDLSDPAEQQLIRLSMKEKSDG